MFFRWLTLFHETGDLERKLREIEESRRIATERHEQCISNNKTVYVGYCNVEFMETMEKLDKEKEKVIAEHDNI
jgi:hypothetical protein